MLRDDGMPGMYEVVLPILHICSDGRIRRGDELTEQVADYFDLTREQRFEVTRGGNQLKIKDRTLWAVTHLCRAGLLCKPSRGAIGVTPAGKRIAEDDEVLEITSHDLMEFPSHVEWKLGGAGRRAAPLEGGGRSPADVLKARLAAGEIDVDEYLRLREIIDPDDG